MNTPGNKAAKKSARLVAAPSILTCRAPSQIALILGGADCVHVDREAALALFTPDLIICTNEIGRDYPGYFDHWVSMHPDRTATTPGLAGWVREREAAGRPMPGQLWMPQHRQPPKGFADRMRRLPSWGGSSGLLACTLCVVILNCRGVLCGVPMRKENAHYNNPRQWAEADRYKPSWIRHEHMKLLRDRIKSMSGWTQELLGAPTREWLYAVEQRAA